MSHTITILAGEFVHPTTTQFQWLAQRVPQDLDCRLEIHEDARALERLGASDLFIAAGLHWSQSPHVSWTTPRPYLPANEAQKAGLRAYHARGGATLGFHGGIASFDDWPEFGQLLGYAWHWDITSHGPHQEYRVHAPDNTPLVGAPFREFRVRDENYYNVQLQLGQRYQTHLRMDCGATQPPMLLTHERSKMGGGTARGAYLGLGHDMEAIAGPGFDHVFWNTVRWLLHSPTVH